MPTPRAKSLLEIQLKKHGLNPTELPCDLPSWQTFISRIETTYNEFNDSLISSENILEVSLKEMEGLHNNLSESSQKKIIEINDFLGLILYASDLGTWDWNLLTNEVSFDKRWCEIIGRTVEQTPQKLDSFKTYLHPNDLPRVLKTAEDYMNKRIERYEVHFQMKHSKGHWVDILAKGKVINFNADGKPLRFIGTHLDVSDEKEMNRQLEVQRLKLLQSSKMASLGELSAGIAHEINNPLTIIEGTLDLLPKLRETPDKFGAKIESMRKACHRIVKIVSGLKKFSRTGDKVNLKQHSLCAIVRESITLTESKSKKTDTPVLFDSDRDFKILCDEIEIEQVLVNLINNGIDAVKNRTERWVKITVSEEDAFIVLKTFDSGPGVPESIRSRIFDPFFTTKVVGEGTGLGLSITKGILDEHKATIVIVPDAPNTCFEIRFPKIELLASL